MPSDKHRFRHDTVWQRATARQCIAGVLWRGGSLQPRHLKPANSALLPPRGEHGTALPCTSINGGRCPTNQPPSDLHSAGSLKLSIQAKILPWRLGGGTTMGEEHVTSLAGTAQDTSAPPSSHLPLNIHASLLSAANDDRDGEPRWLSTRSTQRYQPLTQQRRLAHHRQPYAP